jgi:hypothetical protein
MQLCFEKYDHSNESEKHIHLEHTFEKSDNQICNLKSKRTSFPTLSNNRSSHV